MEPGLVVDEMFPEGTSPTLDMEDETRSNSTSEMNEKHMEEFLDELEDLNDDDDF